MGTGSRVVCAGGGVLELCWGGLPMDALAAANPVIGSEACAYLCSGAVNLGCVALVMAMCCPPPSIPAAGGWRAGDGSWLLQLLRDAQGAAGLPPATVVTAVSTRVTSWFKPIYVRSEAEELGTAPESDLEGKRGLVVCALAV